MHKNLRFFQLTTERLKSQNSSNVYKFLFLSGKHSPQVRVFSQHVVFTICANIDYYRRTCRIPVRMQNGFYKILPCNMFPFIQNLISIQFYSVIITFLYMLNSFFYCYCCQPMHQTILQFCGFKEVQYIIHSI